MNVYLENDGQHDQAINLSREAQEIWLKQARFDPANLMNLHHQAEAEIGLAIEYSNVNDKARASLHAVTGVNIERRVGSQDTVHRVQMADWILWPTGQILGAEQRYDEAIGLTKEALGTYQRIAQALPTERLYRNDQTRALVSLAVLYWAKGDRATAATEASQAADIDRVLAAEDPATYLPDYGSWLLYPIVGYVSGAGQKPQAIKLAQEAVDIYTQLNQGDPAKYGPKLTEARTLLASVQQG